MSIFPRLAGSVLGTFPEHFSPLPGFDRCMPFFGMKCYSSINEHNIIDFNQTSFRNTENLIIDTTEEQTYNFKKINHMTQNNSQTSDLTYVRSSSDYTVSSHQVFSNMTRYKNVPYIKVIHIPNAGLDALAKITDDLYKKLSSLGNFALDSKSSIDYDDGEEEKDNYSIYHQSVLAFTNRDKCPYPYPHSHCVVIEIVAGIDRVHVAILSDKIDYAEELYAMLVKNKSSYVVDKKIQENTFYTISQNMHGFSLESLKLNTQHSDEIIFDNYNDDFQAAHGVIHNSIEDDKRGLILLHGIPGSGKTSYIKNLITAGTKRKIVYIPPHLAAAIASPSFIKFVKEELAGCVLVIEDAEQILLSRESVESHKEAVSNILNMTDGILAEALNLLIICTFNTDLQALDKALLRKGRLLLQYKFDELQKEKADLLANKLYGKSVGKSMPLCDIFNLDYELITPKAAPKVKFGFA